MFSCITKSKLFYKNGYELRRIPCYSTRRLILKLFAVVLLLIAGNNSLAAISLNVTVSNVSANYYSGESIFFNGSISIAASGGIAPYTYEILTWGQNNNAYFPGMPPGFYQIIVTDANGQTANATATISSIYPVPAVTTSNIIFPSSCNSADGGFTLIGTGGTAPYLYSIDGGVTFTSNNIFVNLRQGLHVGILKDANGLIAFTRVYGSILTPYFFSCNCCSFIGFAYPSGPSSCTNSIGAIEVQVQQSTSGGVPPFRCSLDGVTYFQLNGGFGNFYYREINGLSPGLYTVYLKDSLGAEWITNTSIAQYCRIQISYVSVEASCQQRDGTISIIATNGVSPYSYTMDGINYQVSNIFTGLASGVYSIGVKDANGVTNSSTAIVYNKCPVVTATKTDDSCGQAKGSISVHGIKGANPYLFSIDRINYQTDSNFINLTAAIYPVILKDANGFFDSTFITIDNNCLLISTNSTDGNCGNQNGTIAVTGSGGTTPYSYSIDGNNFQANPNFPGLSSGIYAVTIKDATGLTSTTGDTIINIPGPSINASATTANCDGTAAIISVTSIAGTAPFLYSIDSVIYQSSNIFTGVNAGNYIVSIKDANSCIENDTIQVTKYPTPTVFTGNDTALCTGQTILLEAPA